MVLATKLVDIREATGEAFEVAIGNGTRGNGLVVEIFSVFFGDLLNFFMHDKHSFFLF